MQNHEMQVYFRCQFCNCLINVNLTLEKNSLLFINTLLIQLENQLNLVLVSPFIFIIFIKGVLVASSLRLQFGREIHFGSVSRVNLFERTATCARSQTYFIFFDVIVSVSFEIDLSYINYSNTH